MMRIGVLGGACAAGYIESLRAISGIEVVSGTADDVILQKPDGVIIASTLAKRPTMIERIAEHVPYILCEPPFAPGLEQARAVVSACELRGSLLLPAFVWRFAPTLVSLKQALDQGKLGKPVGLKAVYQGKFPAEPACTEGGVMLNRTLHMIDLLSWLLDQPVVEVQAEISKGLLYPDIDNASVLSVGLANGAYVTLDVSWSLPANYPLEGNLRIEILGDSGSIKLDAFCQSLDVYAADIRRIYWGSHQRDELVRHFMDCISSNGKPLIGTNTALRAHEVAQLALRAALSAQCLRL